MDTILHSSVCSIDSNKLLESSGVVLSCISIKYAAAATATSEHFGRTLLHFFHQLLTLLVIYTRRCTFTVHQLHSSGGRWPRPDYEAWHNLFFRLFFEAIEKVS